jgi:hypothetical protein
LTTVQLSTAKLGLLLAAKLGLVQAPAVSTLMLLRKSLPPMLMTAVRLYCKVLALTPVTTGGNSAPPPQAHNCAANTRATRDLKDKNKKRVGMGCGKANHNKQGANCNADAV